jgi:hypothetical protein
VPTFDTPEPISVEVDLSMAVGNVRVVASDRVDTVVEVRPTDGTRKPDVRAAAETRVDHAGGRLLVEFTRHWRHTNPFSRNGSVEVLIELPAGSHLRGDVAVGGLHCTGRLGEVRYTTHRGDIAVAAAAGPLDVRTGHGQVRVGAVDGPVVVQNDKGECRIDDVTGDLRLTGVNGGMHVGRAGGDVEARNANGAIRVAEVARGSVVLTTASGELEVGVPAGVAAWLDVRTVGGRLRNSLDATTGPDGAEDTVAIRARTYDGDIVIRRAG